MYVNLDNKMEMQVLSSFIPQVLSCQNDFFYKVYYVKIFNCSLININQNTALSTLDPSNHKNNC